MVIKEERPITMSEVVALVGDSEKSKNIKEFIRNFNKMPLNKALEMKSALKSLNILKLKEIHIVKIIDFMPEEISELNKLIIDISLDQEEINKILDVVKKY